MPATLKRLLNELPSLAVIGATILGLSESDAAVWQEAAASIAALVTWFTVRASVDGPVRVVEREVQVRRALANIKERHPVVLESNHAETTTPTPDYIRFEEGAANFLVQQGYTKQVAERSVRKYLAGEDMTPQEANCITQVRQSGIRVPEVR